MKIRDVVVSQFRIICSYLGQESRSDDLIDIVNCLLNALSVIVGLVVVSQFQSFVDPS